jgi:DNA ligase-1
LSDRFPEVVSAGRALPDGTVLDGEILAWSGESPLPFGVLQTRIGRKNVTKSALRTAPIIFMAYDLLEQAGQDLRALPLTARRAKLEQALAELPRAVDPQSSPRISHVRLSPVIAVADWNELAFLRLQARDNLTEGIMLKRRSSPYAVGRPRGDWWKWKTAPLAIDAVLIAAQPGHGKRASLFTDYTFAVWDRGELVTVAKAYSGLTDDEIRTVDRYVREHTLGRFGPVRSVTPELVFELHFEGVQPSPRHKAGFALRFPRIARWRTDKPAHEADTLDTVRQLAAVQAATRPNQTENMSAERLVQRRLFEE